MTDWWKGGTWLISCGSVAGRMIGGGRMAGQARHSSKIHATTKPAWGMARTRLSLSRRASHRRPRWQLTVPRPPPRLAYHVSWQIRDRNWTFTSAANKIRNCPRPNVWARIGSRRRRSGRRDLPGPTGCRCWAEEEFQPNSSFFLASINIWPWQRAEGSRSGSVGKPMGSGKMDRWPSWRGIEEELFRCCGEGGFRLFMDLHLGDIV